MVIAVSAVYSTRKGLEAFRGFKRLGNAVSSEVERIEQVSGEIEAHLNLATESGSRLEAKLAELRRSRASNVSERASRRSAIDESARACGRGQYGPPGEGASESRGGRPRHELDAPAGRRCERLGLEEVVRRLEITRLGEGVTSDAASLSLPIARVRNVLSAYRRELESLGAERTLCIATSAVRDAENGEAFLGEIEWSYGFTTRLLSGDEEAAMTLRGIGVLEPGTLVVDIGGGSTEVQVTGTGVRESLDVGCVRLTERFGEDVDAIRGHVRGLLPRVEAERAVGVAGTVTTIAALDLELAVRPGADPRPRDLT